jgi:hypothetical protein
VVGSCLSCQQLDPAVRVARCSLPRTVTDATRLHTVRRTVGIQVQAPPPPPRRRPCHGWHSLTADDIASERRQLKQQQAAMEAGLAALEARLEGRLAALDMSEGRRNDAKDALMVSWVGWGGGGAGWQCWTCLTGAASNDAKDAHPR